MRLLKKLFYCSFILVYSNCYADLGIFQPKVVPNEVYVNELQRIKFSAEIGIENRTVEWVKIYEVDKSGVILREIGVMNDKGLNGDERLGDAIFSTEVAIKSSKKEKRFFQIIAKYKELAQQYQTQNLQLSFFVPIPMSVVTEG